MGSTSTTSPCADAHYSGVDWVALARARRVGGAPRPSTALVSPAGGARAPHARGAAEPPPGSARWRPLRRASGGTAETRTTPIKSLDRSRFDGCSSRRFVQSSSSLKVDARVAAVLDVDAPPRASRRVYGRRSGGRVSRVVVARRRRRVPKTPLLDALASSRRFGRLVLAATRRLHAFPSVLRDFSPPSLGFANARASSAAPRPACPSRLRRARVVMGSPPPDSSTPRLRPSVSSATVCDPRPSVAPSWPSSGVDGRLAEHVAGRARGRRRRGSGFTLGRGNGRRRGHRHLLRTRTRRRGPVRGDSIASMDSSRDRSGGRPISSSSSSPSSPPARATSARARVDARRGRLVEAGERASSSSATAPPGRRRRRRAAPIRVLFVLPGAVYRELRVPGRSGASSSSFSPPRRRRTFVANVEAIAFVFGDEVSVIAFGGRGVGEYLVAAQTLATWLSIAPETMTTPPRAPSRRRTRRRGARELEVVAVLRPSERPPGRSRSAQDGPA